MGVFSVMELAHDTSGTPGKPPRHVLIHAGHTLTLSQSHSRRRGARQGKQATGKQGKAWGRVLSN